LDFAKQIWNRLNQFLFNFIDSIILVDILETLFSKPEKKAIKELDKYAGDISKSTKISPNDISKNLKRNSMY